MNEQDWKELAAAYKVVAGNPEEELAGFAERVDTRHNSGAMSTIYKVGAIVRIDIKEIGA